MNIPIFSIRKAIVLFTGFFAVSTFPVGALAWDRYMPATALHNIYEAGQAHEQANRPDRAREAYRELEKRSREWDFPDWTLYAIWSQGAMEHRYGNFPEAVSFYAAGLEFVYESAESEDEIDPQSELGLLSNLRSVQWYAGNLNESLNVHRSVLERAGLTFASNQPDWDFEAMLSALHDPLTFKVAADAVLFELRLRFQKGDTAGAADAFQRLAGFLEGHAGRAPGVDRSLAEAYSDLIGVYEYQEKFGRSLEAYERFKSLSLADETDFFRYLESVRAAHFRLVMDEISVEEALATVAPARAGIAELRVFLTDFFLRGLDVRMHAQAGRSNEALELADKLLADLEGYGASMLAPALGAYSQVAANHIDEPGYAPIFDRCLRKSWMSGYFSAQPFIYSYYASYLFNSGERSKALLIARLGLVHCELAEAMSLHESLEKRLSEWSTEVGQDEISPVPSPFEQTEEEQVFSAPELLTHSPFGFVGLRYRLPVPEGANGVNVRARAGSPVRIEFRDPESGYLIGVDSLGDGSFSTTGDIAFLDRNGNGFPELPTSGNGDSPALELMVYPGAVAKDGKGVAVSELDIVLEIKHNGEWEHWARTRLRFEK